MKKLDSIHIDFSPIDGREKALNAVMCSRHDGKTTTFLVKKFWPAWKKGGCPLVLLFRNVNDVKPATVEYYANLLNEFLEEPVKLKYSEAQFRNGTATAYVDKKPFFHLVALNQKETSLKKIAFPNVKYVLFDELEVNPKSGEKYLKNEYGKFQAYFDTQLKITPKAKFYGLTNPYSLVNPYFRAWGVDTRNLKLDTIQTGANWAVWYKRLNPLLAERIKAEDPLFSEEGEYSKMAFLGLPANDLNNHVEPMRGAYRLHLLFVHDGVKYGVYKTAEPLDYARPYYYVKEEKDHSERRMSFAFSFDDLIENSLIASKRDRDDFAHFKMAMRKQDVAFDKIETESAFQTIFDYL